MVTRANPNRAAAAEQVVTGYQVSNWDQEMQNMHELDVFLPSIESATQWVGAHYPAARVKQVKNNAVGEVVGLIYEI